MSQWENNDSCIQFLLAVAALIVILFVALACPPGHLEQRESIKNWDRSQEAD